MGLIHRIRKVILRSSRFLSVINSSQDNIINDKLDKTDPSFTSPSGPVVPAVIPANALKDTGGDYIFDLGSNYILI